MSSNKSKKNERESHEISGIFFPEDFKKLPKNTVILIKQGKVMVNG